MEKKRIIYILVGIAIVVAIYFPGFSKLQELREENRNLEKRIEVLTKTNSELEKEKNSLENDPAYIEKIAREKLGLVKKDEIILK